MSRVRGACLAFSQICVVMEVVVGLILDDSPLQGRSGAELSFGLSGRLCASWGWCGLSLRPYTLRCGQPQVQISDGRRIAHVLQRIAMLKRRLEFQH
jgi:hypothetical protein